MIATVASKEAAEQDPAYRPAPADYSSPSGPIEIFSLRQVSPLVDAGVHAARVRYDMLGGPHQEETAP